MHTERPPVLANPRSDRVKKLAALGGRSVRIRQGRFLIEGPQSVREAIRFIPQGLHVYVQDNHPSAAVAKIVAGCPARSLTYATEAVMHAISADCQGIAAVAPLDFATHHRLTDSDDVGSRLRTVLGEADLLMCLPHISDPGNAGTLIRIADAAGAGGVLLGRGSVEVTNPKVVRSAAGSLFHLPVLTGLEPLHTIGVLRAAGYTTIGADGYATQDVTDIDLSGRIAWVFGHEAHGLGEQGRRACDVLAKIPLLGHAESLNVAAAAAVCMYARQLQGKYGSI